MKKFLACTLIVSLVLASLYVPVIVHTCYLFNTTNTTLYSSVTCCEATSADADQISTNCCGVNMKTFKADIASYISHPDFSNSHQLITDIFTYENVRHNKTEPLISAIGIRPPPISLSNRILLTHINKLVI